MAYPSAWRETTVECSYLAASEVFGSQATAKLVLSQDLLMFRSSLAGWLQNTGISLFQQHFLELPYRIINSKL